MDVNAYQMRLRTLIAEAQSGGVSLRELARKMGDESYHKSISYWMTSSLNTAISPRRYSQLAKIDPKHRSPEQLEYWLRTGKAMPELADIPDRVLLMALRAC